MQIHLHLTPCLIHKHMGAPCTEWYNQDVGLDLGPKYFIGSMDGDHKII